MCPRSADSGDTRCTMRRTQVVARSVSGMSVSSATAPGWNGPSAPDARISTAAVQNAMNSTPPLPMKTRRRDRRPDRAGQFNTRNPSTTAANRPAPKLRGALAMSAAATSGGNSTAPSRPSPPSTMLQAFRKLTTTSRVNGTE